MAVEKTIELNVELDGLTEAEKALKKFGGTLEEVAGEGAQPLNFAIGELEDRLYELQAAGKGGTAEFREMAEEVGRMKKVIIDTDLVIDGMSQTLNQNVGGAIQGLASGFTFAQGAMATFGVESEAIEETLLKVQSAMAISEGLRGIRESIASFKGLGAALAKTAMGQKLLTAAQVIGAKAMKVLNLIMNANPVLLIVTGIVALTAAMKYFTAQTLDASVINEKLNEIFEARNKALQETIDKTRKLGQQQLEMLQATGASEEELHNQRLKNLKTEEQARKDQMKEIQVQNKANRQVLKLARERGQDELADEIAEEIKKNKDKYDELNAQHGDYNHKKKLEDIAYQKHLDEQAEEEARKEKERQRAAFDRYKQYLADRVAARRQIEDAEFELFRNFEERERQLRQRALDDIENDEKLNREEKEARKAQEEQRFNEQELARASEFFELKKIQVLEQERTISDLEIQAHTQREEEKTRISIEQRKENLEDFMQNQEFTLEMTKQGLSIITDLTNAFAGESEEAQKRAFRINKAVGIANATIDTYQAATKAYASQLIPGDPSSPIRAAVAAGFAVASGLAKVAIIARTKFDSSGAGGGGSAGGGSSSFGGGGATSRPAEFNVVGNTGNNQLAQTLGSSPMKAYVVGGDVTSQQALDRNKIDTATL